MNASDALLSTKVHVPRGRANSVARPRLVEGLLAGLQPPSRLVLLSGPAGFGKTTLLIEFAASVGRPVAWLSLDETDDDPTRFWVHLIAACQRVQPGIGAAALELCRIPQTPPDDAVSTLLANDLATLEHDLVLVLDDYHVIQRPSIHAGLFRLVDHLPERFHVILSTRTDPPLPLARLRARGQLVELRAKDLRFSSEEVTAFLNGMAALNLAPADVARLADRTEGWAAGLQLAALSLKGQSDIPGFIRAFAGSHAYIADYLVEEVLRRQPDEVQTFLLQTSLLGRLTGGLCEAITGCPDGQGQLQALYRNNLFLMPLDDAQQWFRYHALFTDLLAFRLKQTLPRTAIRDLHRRASDWLAAHDLFDDALHHALAAEDFPHAIALVERIARPMLFSGRAHELRRWLEALPASAAEAHPYLKLYRTWIDLQQGRLDLSEPALLKMEAQLRALPPSPENETLLKEMLVVLSHWVALAGNTHRAIALAHEALAFLPEADQASRARVFSALAIAYGSEGQVDQADAAFRECLRLAYASDNYALAAQTMLRAGIWLGYYGRLREAAQLYQSIVAMSTRAGQAVFFPAGQGLIGLASIHLERCDWAAAEAALEQGMTLCQQAGLEGVFIGWLLAARLRRAKGDVLGALDELQALEQTFPRTDPFTLTVHQIEIRLALGDVDRAYRLAIPFMDQLEAQGAAEKAPEMVVPPVVVEMVLAVLSRVYLARGETDQALALLGRLQASAEPAGRLGHLLEAQLLQSLALSAQHGGIPSAQAVGVLERALALAEPEGYALLFVESGPALAPLLRAVARAAGVPGRVKSYAGRLLSLVTAASGPAPAGDLAPSGELAESLTEREQDVLRLVAEGLTYAEIAGRLYLSINTVRTYIKALYGKLGVNNRSRAIARAREHALI